MLDEGCMPQSGRAEWLGEILLLLFLNVALTHRTTAFKFYTLYIFFVSK